MQSTIAIVEDDPDQRRNYVDALERRGYRVQVYHSRPAAQEVFMHTLPDLAILDIMLGDDLDGGFELCRYLLSRDPDLPVIFLTGRSDDIDRISGLRLGAWDYQAKPVSLAFLVERVASLLRIRDLKAGTAKQREVECIGELEIDQDRLEARWQGQVLQLTFTEFNLLTEIVRCSKGRGASYEDLARATRQGLVENNTVNTHVMHLRRKLQGLDPGFDAIRNVYGYGYRWSLS